MQPWAIILITIGSGLIVFGLVLFLKNQKSKQHQNASHLPMMVTNPNAVPSTNHGPVFNTGTPPTMYQMPTMVHSQGPRVIVQGNNVQQGMIHGYHGQQGVVHGYPVQQGYAMQPVVRNNHPNTVYGHPATGTAYRIMGQPGVSFGGPQMF